MGALKSMQRKLRSPCTPSGFCYLLFILKMKRNALWQEEPRPRLLLPIPERRGKPNVEASTLKQQHYLKTFPQAPSAREEVQLQRQWCREGRALGPPGFAMNFLCFSGSSHLFFFFLFNIFFLFLKCNWYPMSCQFQTYNIASRQSWTWLRAHHDKPYSGFTVVWMIFPVLFFPSSSRKQRP